MSIRYHNFSTETAAAAKLAELRRAGGIAFLITCSAERHEVRELYAVAAPPSAIDAHIGSLADAQLEPMTAAPAGGHVVIDARDRDVWERAS